MIEELEEAISNYELDEFDRIAKLQETNKKDNLLLNSYLGFSGGKDSIVASKLIDLAFPNNNIPRIFVNTGIEYSDIVRFVKSLAVNDKRIIIVNSGVNIPKMLTDYGYPFKSKQHSHNIAIYQNNRDAVDDIVSNIESNPKLKMDYDYISNLPKGTKTLTKYIFGVRERERELYSTQRYGVPKVLRYNFTSHFTLNCSDKCCYKLKKDVFAKFESDNNKTIAISGSRKGEGGNRNNLTCFSKRNNTTIFNVLAPLSDEFMDWFINKHDIELCKLYLPPFNFKRTGCKGCPFALDLQAQLQTMKQLLPNEAKQCEMIWKPVYDEYRRRNYRLKSQLTIFDI